VQPHELNHTLVLALGDAHQHDDFSGLVTTSMQHDGDRPRNDVSISGLTASYRFRRMLAVLQSDNEYAQEYKRFVSGVSYSAPEQTPGFTEAVDALWNLVKALHLDTKI